MFMLPISLFGRLAAILIVLAWWHREKANESNRTFPLIDLTIYTG
jgi:hypothetical protein